MTFDPTTNRVPMHLLTEEEKHILISAKHGWQRYFANEDEWREADQPLWFVMNIYRAKPAPAVESVWFNVYPEPHGSGTNGVYLSSPHDSLEKARCLSTEDCIGLARFDLIDGVLSVELEPLGLRTGNNDDVDFSNLEWMQIDG